MARRRSSPGSVGVFIVKISRVGPPSRHVLLLCVRLLLRRVEQRGRVVRVLT